MPGPGDWSPALAWRDLMKKMVKKLTLSRETLKNLATQDLKQAAGGIVETDQPECMQTNQWIS